MYPESRVESNEPSLPSYELTPDQVHGLTERLLNLESVSAAPDKYRYVAVAVDGDSEFANLGRYIEKTVFDEAFKNDADQMAEEYGPYESASRFYISIDRETIQPSGVLRIIQNSTAGLKSYDDALGEPFFAKTEAIKRQSGMADLDKVWDVGTIAVPREYRAKEGPVSILLQRAMYTDAHDRSVQALISIVDNKALVKMRSKFRGVGIPFGRLGKSKSGPYLGSKKSHAVSGYVPEFYEKMSKHRNSLRGRLLARYALGDALDRLVEGTQDDAIILNL